jgi:glucose uptake protein
VQVGPAVSYALGQGATLISVLWGLLVWKEFRGATPRVKGLLAAMILLFIAGLSMVATAPLVKREVTRVAWGW